jgi:uncharacterized membrane protein
VVWSVRATLAVLAAAWTAALVFAPVLPAVLSAAFYAAGSIICHQIPERSFHLGAFQLPVCARCLGLYAGGFVGAFASLVVASPGWLPTRRWRLAATIVGAIPTTATIVLEHGMGWPLSNGTRALAAVPLATAIAFVVATGAATLHYDECAPRRPIGHGQTPPPANT